MKSLFYIFISILFFLCSCTNAKKDSDGKVIGTLIDTLTSKLCLSDTSEDLRPNVEYIWKPESETSPVRAIRIKNDTITIDGYRFRFEKQEVSVPSFFTKHEELVNVYKKQGIEFPTGEGEVTYLSLSPVDPLAAMPQEIARLVDDKIVYLNQRHIRVVTEWFFDDFINDSYLTDAVKLPFSYSDLYYNKDYNFPTYCDVFGADDTPFVNSLIRSTKPYFLEMRAGSWSEERDRPYTNGGVFVYILKKTKSFYTYLLRMDVSVGEYNMKTLLFIITALNDDNVIPIDVLQVDSQLGTFNFYEPQTIEVVSDKLTDVDKYTFGEDSLKAQVETYVIDSEGKINLKATSSKLFANGNVYLRNYDEMVFDKSAHVDSLQIAIGSVSDFCKEILPLRYSTSRTHVDEDKSNELDGFFKYKYFSDVENCSVKNVPHSLLKYLGNYDYYMDFNFLDPVTVYPVIHHLEGLDILFAHEEFDITSNISILVCRGNTVLSRLSLGCGNYLDGYRENEFVMEEDLTIKSGRWTENDHFLKFHSWKIQNNGSIVQLD